MSDGSEYRPLGALPGDQVFPAVALSASKGLVAWQDNTDGAGLAIRGRLLGSQLSGMAAPFYLNSTFAGDQENVKIVVLRDDGFLVLWQGGLRGAQQIFARVLGPDGLFKGAEIQVSSGGQNHRNPSGCLLTDGTVAVVWTALDLDGDMEGVALARLSQAGQVIGTPTQVNVGAAYNQRDATVIPYPDGTFTAAWISEQQPRSGVASIFARRYAADGTALTGDLSLVTGDNPCATPGMVLTDGGFLLVWNEYQLEDNDYGWDIKARPFSRTAAPTGPETVVNALRKGDQTNVRATRFGADVLVLFTGRLDRSGLGIGSQVLTAAGERTDLDLALNTSTRGDQTTPAVASDDKGRALAVWSSFGSTETGLDLYAQRLGLSGPPLLAPAPPYATALSSSKLRVSWPALDGLPVRSYHVQADGAAPIATTNPFLLLSGLAPGSSHSLRLTYELLDGRISPASEAVTAITWGDDGNADGLPDDWQAENFGPDPDGWPPPGADSDADGKTNREEFMAGTDPRNTASVLRTALTQTEQGTLLTWNARPGGLYQVQHSTDLVEWFDYQGIRVATEETSAVLLGNVPENSYFRVNYLR